MNLTVAWLALQEGHRVRVKAGDGRGDKGLGLSKGDIGGPRLVGFACWAEAPGPA